MLKKSDPVLLRKKYIFCYGASLVALAVVLLASTGLFFWHISHPNEPITRLVQLSLLLVVLGFLLLSAQAMLIVRKVVLQLGKGRERLEELEHQVKTFAEVDLLTGALNRKKLLKITARELENIRRYGGTLSCLFIDVDNFRTVNDKWGYAIGDSFLIAFVRHLKKQVRQTDYLFRWRGGKFMILAPSTDGSQVQLLAKKIDKSLAKKQFGGRIVISISTGHVEASPQETLENFLQHAQSELAVNKNKRENSHVTS